MLAFGVCERIDERLATDAVRFFADHWVQFPHGAFDDGFERCVSTLGSLFHNLLECLPQASRSYRFGSQIPDAVSWLSHHLLGSIECLFEIRMRWLVRRYLLSCCINAQNQSVDTL